jgi:hypothetical protein
MKNKSVNPHSVPWNQLEAFLLDYKGLPSDDPKWGEIKKRMEKPSQELLVVWDA